MSEHFMNDSCKKRLPGSNACNGKVRPIRPLDFRHHHYKNVTLQFTIRIILDSAECSTHVTTGCQLHYIWRLLNRNFKGYILIKNV